MDCIDILIIIIKKVLFMIISKTRNAYKRTCKVSFKCGQSLMKLGFQLRVMLIVAL